MTDLALIPKKSALVTLVGRLFKVFAGITIAAVIVMLASAVITLNLENERLVAQNSALQNAGFVERCITRTFAHVKE